MVRIPTHRTPTHSGEMLIEEFLKPMGLTQRELADAIHVPYQRINEIINGRRGMTPSTALRLSRFFGVSPEFRRQGMPTQASFFISPPVLSSICQTIETVCCLGNFLCWFFEIWSKKERISLIFKPL